MLVRQTPCPMIAVDGLTAARARQAAGAIRIGGRESM